MARYRFLLGLAVLSVSLFVVSIETQARTRSVSRDTLGAKHSSVKNASNLRTRKARTLKEKSTPIRRASACSMVQDLEWGSSCFFNCMYNAGVTREKMAGCFAICVGAGSGNPLAIAVCAACVGVGEWVAGYCGLRCAWGHAFAMEDGQISRSRSHPRNKRVPHLVRLRILPARDSSPD